jgi:hypothetical protein
MTSKTNNVHIIMIHARIVSEGCCLQWAANKPTTHRAHRTHRAQTLRLKAACGEDEIHRASCVRNWSVTVTVTLVCA